MLIHPIQFTVEFNTQSIERHIKEDYLDCGHVRCAILLQTTCINTIKQYKLILCLSAEEVRMPFLYSQLCSKRFLLMTRQKNHSFQSPFFYIDKIKELPRRFKKWKVRRSNLVRKHVHNVVIETSQKIVYCSDSLLLVLVIINTL